MSREGLEIARDHGGRLPAFPSQAEAELALFPLRDQRLTQIRTWAAGSGFVADGAPESLKAVEAWYFSVVANPRTAISATKDELDAALGVYFGHVFVESAGFGWIVEQDAFVPGHYGFGVRKGLLTLILTHGVSPDPLERNRRQQSLFRKYKKYAA
jgi:hypothetical protein